MGDGNGKTDFTLDSLQNKLTKCNTKLQLIQRRKRQLQRAIKLHMLGNEHSSCDDLNVPIEEMDSFFLHSSVPYLKGRWTQQGNLRWKNGVHTIAWTATRGQMVLSDKKGFVLCVHHGIF